MSLIPVEGKPGHYRDTTTGKVLIIMDTALVQIFSEAGSLYKADMDKMIEEARVRLTRVGFTPAKIDLAGVTPKLLADGRWEYTFYASAYATTIKS